MRKPTGSDWKDGFLFLGNQTALDFLNTRLMQDGELVELLPDFDAVLRWFRAADWISPAEAASFKKRWGGSARARRVLDAFQELRERLRREVLSLEKGAAVSRSTIDELNRLLATHPMRTRLNIAGKGYSTELWFDPQEPEDLVAPLAYGAAMLFAEAQPDRLRKCEHCVLHFVDTSKKGTRRWCSMRMCGNRSKVAAYAARQRER